MTDDDGDGYAAHLRLSGARALLRAFAHTGIPADPGERAERLQPYLRALWERGTRGGRDLYEVAAELRAASRAPHVLGLPEQPALRELTDLAEYVERWPEGVAGKLAGAEPTADELASRFPLLSGMLVDYFGPDGIAVEDELAADDGLRVFVADHHPYCPWWLPGLVAECHEALALFHDEDALRRFFQDVLSCGSGGLPWEEWLPLISSTFTDHMRERHPSPRFDRART
ncbi:hypothetical protein [Streptomyces sp. NPDC048172]|uniref:hypothetical protein n=1 Tax=Streptomyces sp. NPDC048172 TaxID=3365505 RepID=UPI003714DB16